MKFGSLVALIADAASRINPAKPAVVNSDGSLSYQQLLSGARGIAATLREAGVGRNDRVGIWMDKTPACVQTILGVLMAGAAYVPLDPRAPWRRCRTIALDCCFAAIAVDAPKLASLADFLEGQSPRLVLIEDQTLERTTAALGPSDTIRSELVAVAATRDAGDLTEPSPEDLAYILYTSGSTGTPKGVVHTHASALAFTQWVRQRFGIVATDVFSSHAPFHFDLSIADLYASLGSGATVRLISSTEGMLPPFLVKSITEWKITIWYSVPSILVAMLDKGGIEQHGLPTLRILFFAGEVFPTAQLRRLRRSLPGVGLYNLFGPTETNVCTYYEVPAQIPDELAAPIPIGRACEHMETFVLDDEGREAAVGREGTLWAKGGNLMRGYWNDPARTEATLRPDPRGRTGLAYCTGDRVRLHSDGNYEFLGRRDHMIKTRGYRVELGDIEGALAGFPGVLEAVATALPDPAIGNRIVASVVSQTGRELDIASLRSHCKQCLPIYMLPDAIEVRSAFPRTSTGKVDRTALRSEWEQKK
ncbi:MAG: amino acid adenylation domain-containing protein [Verrucomicrobia bacterium]|nr:amino acid adenylation domain-containing protein [Verrucomicrobiota bacterium]